MWWLSGPAPREKYIEASAVHETIASFEAGLKNNDTAIAPSMVYAYAAVSQVFLLLMVQPNLTTDIPAIIQLARKNKAAIGGKDFKTGQTLMKTVVAPGLAARSLGVTGWYSTNILGNRDGLVLDDEQNFKTKEVSSSVYWKIFCVLTCTLIFMATCTTRSGSIIILLMATIRRAGTISTFLAG